MILFGIGYCNMNQDSKPTRRSTPVVVAPVPVVTPSVSQKPEPPPGDKTFTNSLGMKFVYIPPGTFTIGSPSDETQRKVTLTEGFHMQTTEVTQGQWKAEMENNPSYFKDCGDDCPVESVSTNDVQDFIKKLNQKGEGTYRLPTKAEWEYAARAGSSTTIQDNMQILDDKNAPALDPVAWYGGNSCVDYNGGVDCSGWRGKRNSCPKCGTHPVAKKYPNYFGLYDMLGNVWEMFQSSGSLYGGSWRDDARSVRHCKILFHPELGNDDDGFRLVRNP